MLYLNVHDSSTSNSRQRLEARGSLAADKRIKEIPYKHAVKFSHKQGRVWILTVECKSPETIVSILAENSYPQILRTWMLNRLGPFRFFKSLSSQMVFSSVFRVSVFPWESCSEENRGRERISSDDLASAFFFFFFFHCQSTILWIQGWYLSTRIVWRAWNQWGERGQEWPTQRPLFSEMSSY